MPDRIDEIGSALRALDEAAPLRQAGRNDPEVGVPLKHQLSRDPSDFVMIEPGQWKAEGWASQRTGLPPGCPVMPLGREGQKSFFLDTMGCLFELDAKSSGKGPVGALFGGRSRYLVWAWPRWSVPKNVRRKVKTEDGETTTEVIELPSKINGWASDEARQDLVDACSYMGVYNPTDTIRGRGAWKAADGSLVLHVGDAVWIGGGYKPPGEHDGFIYPARPKIGRPSARPQPAGEGGPGQELLDIFESFNWDRPVVDPRLTLGWLMTAKIGGALHRRPVLFVHGGEGSGKSTLQDVLRVVMNGAMVATADASQAGIYHHIQQDSIAVLVDELEAKEEKGGGIDKILALARIAYSGDKMHRGSKEGQGKEFTLLSSFMASAVNKPATDAQDDSRMAVVMLREREQAGGKLAGGAPLDAVGRHLTRRWIDWWDRWPELLAVMQAALIEVGHTDRSADTFGTLAAACHVALRDDLPEPGELVDWQRWLNPRELDEITSGERSWRRCMMHLLNASVEQWKTLTQKNLGELFAKIQAAESAGEDASGWWTTIIERLPALGMSITWPNGAFSGPFDTAELFLPANHPSVQAVFEGTPWSGRRGAPGPWCNALRQAPRQLWRNGKSGKGLDRKASGIFINIKQALDV
jgi:hypothetical protein